MSTTVDHDLSVSTERPDLLRRSIGFARDTEYDDNKAEFRVLATFDPAHPVLENPSFETSLVFGQEAEKPAGKSRPNDIVRKV